MQLSSFPISTFPYFSISIFPVFWFPVPPFIPTPLLYVVHVIYLGHTLLDYLTCMPAVCYYLRHQVIKGVSATNNFIATKVDVKQATCTK